MTTLDDVQAGRVGEGTQVPHPPPPIFPRMLPADRRGAFIDWRERLFDTGVPTGDEADVMAWRLAMEVAVATQPPTPTVRVRIAVAVDAEGRWAAAGSCFTSAAGAMEEAGGRLERGAALVWITADLPLPSVPEVAGTVEGGT